MMVQNRLTAVLLTVFVAVASSVLGAVEQVTVRVDGLACPFCAYNIEKRVKTLEGVEQKARIVTSIENGTASFPWKGNVSFDPAVVNQAIRDAGFTPREIVVTVSGVVQAPTDKDAGGLLRVVDKDTEQTVTLARPDRADRREAWEALNVLSKDAKGTLHIQAEGDVRVVGNHGAWQVVVHRWQPVEFGAKVQLKVEEFACEQCSTRTMHALREIDGVIHVQADHEDNRVEIWTTTESPDVSVLRKGIESLGFNVTHVHTQVSTATAPQQKAEQTQ